MWQKWTAHESHELPSHMRVTIDTSADSSAKTDGEVSNGSCGIHALDVDYKPLKSHLEKSKACFNTPISCTFCNQGLPPDGAMSLLCPSQGCSIAGHLDCFASSFLGGDSRSLVPIDGKCPGCGSALRWIDLVKELSLRMRAPKEVEAIMKPKKSRGTKKADQSLAAIGMNELSEDGDDDAQGDLPMEDGWDHISDDSEADVGPHVANSDPGTRFRYPAGLDTKLTVLSEPLIEDSDWDEAEVVL